MQISPPTRARRRAAALLIAALGAPSIALAQRVLGPSADATVLPRGMLRVTTGPEWGRGHERYASGAGRAPRGTVEPLAADFRLDTLGATQFPALTTLGTGVRAIVGGAAPLPITLGPIESRFDAVVSRTPIHVEYGLTRRVTLGALLPLVRTWTEVSVQPNASRTASTVGLNPGYRVAGARNANQLVVSQLQAAAQALDQLLQRCAGASTTECAAVNGDRPRAAALLQAAQAAATGIEAVYGTSVTRPGSRFAPVDSSALQRSVALRLGALSADFASFLGAPPTGAAWIGARPVGAAPFTWGDLQRVVTDTAFGIGADSLVSVGLNRLGDIELGARVLLFDGVGGGRPPQLGPLGGVRARVAAEAVVRLGTAQRDSVNHLADLGTGDGQRDYEGRLTADLLVGSHAWASLSARYTLQQADELPVRVPLYPGDPFPAATRIATVQRDLGESWSLEASPRWVVSDNLAVAATWQFYRKASDRYVTTAAGVDPALLAAGSERQLQRAVVSVTYSTLSQYFRGQARTPMEVSFSVGRTLSGSGNALRQSITGLTLRVYNQLLEGRR